MKGGRPIELVENLMVAFHGALVQLAPLGVEAAPLNGDPEAVAACRDRPWSGGHCTAELEWTLSQVRANPD